MDHDAFTIFLEYLETGRLESNQTVNLYKEMIWIGGFFQIDEFITQCISLINVATSGEKTSTIICDMFGLFEDCLNKLNNSKNQSSWYVLELFQTTVQTMARNLDEFWALEGVKARLMSHISLNPLIIETIIESCLKYCV